MNIELTPHQLNFLTDTFFKTIDSPAGWQRIAAKLIVTGSCVVPSSYTRMWPSATGNFIKSRDWEHGVDCAEYTFDLAEFLSSKLYEEQRFDAEVKLRDDITLLESKLEIYNH